MAQGVLKVSCYALFDRFQRYVEIVRKSATTFLLGNIMISKAQVGCKIIETAKFCLLFVIYYDVWA